ncbi:MAG: RelA/SpoT family protein, partial [Bacteroidales bacterium]|nr:RelA/SpoT family protein [Bacteroidales bacterium]
DCLIMYNEQEKELIREAHLELVASIQPNASPADIKRINLSYEWAYKVYQGQRLSSGKPYMLHLIKVAHIAVAEIGLGVSTVICSMLHGINLKSDYSLDEIEKTFGKTVSSIIDGFNKVSELRTERLSFHSDNFRKLFLSLVDDIRVILLKIAHRLYDLRFPEDHEKAKLEQFVYEVKHLYIPIAHRLGLYIIKAEFEERVMKFENPEIFQAISEKIKATKKKQEAYIQDFIQPVQRELIAQGMDCSIKWRTKSIPSIWAKMKSQNVDFDQVYDLFAIRIIIRTSPKKEKEDCWRAYSIVSDIYTPNPKRLRDWITTPKASGYESLHCTVKAPMDKWVEVQIRSERMDDIAEKGQAAHWQYKASDKKKDSEEWLNQVRDVLENPDQLVFDYAYRNANHYHSDKIFIFTPNGDLKQLPVGSTVLDFAYEIHTQVGSSCSGAKVNNKIVPIRHVLNNGDKVEIVTSKKQKPKSDWLNFVITDRARNKIKKFIKEEDLKESDVGKELLLRKMKNWKISLSDDVVNHLVKHYKTESAAELYCSIATGKVDLMELKKHLMLVSESEKASPKTERENGKNDIKVPAPVNTTDTENFMIIDNTLSNVNYNLAKCCNPIPGDSVFGFVTVSNGITIHRISCPNASRLLDRYNYRILKVRWREVKDSPVFQVTIKITGIDTIGLVGEITKVISSDLKVNMRSISFDTKDGRFDGKISLQIKDTEHLEQLNHKILKVKGVEKVSRIQ